MKTFKKRLKYAKKNDNKAIMKGYFFPWTSDFFFFNKKLFP